MLGIEIMFAPFRSFVHGISNRYPSQFPRRTSGIRTCDQTACCLADVVRVGFIVVWRMQMLMEEQNMMA